MAIRLTSTFPQEEYRSRFVWSAIVILVMFGLLLGRVWHLQIFNGQKWRAFSEANRIEIKRIPSMRGRVLDRNGVVIAESRPSFDLMMTPAHLEETPKRILEKLSQLLKWKNFDSQAVLKKVSRSNPHDEVVVKRDISRDELAYFLVSQHAFPGIAVIDSPARSYPFQMSGSHFLGYLGEVNKDDFRRLKVSEDLEYRLGDVWGISGVEKTFEQYLRGKYGSYPLVEDAKGKPVGEELSEDLLPAFRKQEPVSGQDLLLSVDIHLQQVAENAFRHPVGAVVAMDPNNGDVLALVSRPEYAPEKFVRGVSSTYWNELLQDPDNPLYDRALRGLYPPGSTFKFITAWAALAEKLVTPDEEIVCPGYYRLGRETKRCWKRGGHGAVNLHGALVQSCDVYFYEMGKRLGVDRIAKYAEELGLGSVSGIGINREEKGLIPTQAWKKKVYGQPWVEGETLSVAIGQGALQISPLQLAIAFSALVNGGKVIQPRIVLKTQRFDGKVKTTFPEVIRETASIDQEYRHLIMQALGGVVNEKDGTAYWTARSQKVQIGGKTGTAQVVALKWGKKIEDHAWFIAFAPIQNPKIVVSVIVENGGHGGVTAAPIAKKVIEAYF